MSHSFRLKGGARGAVYFVRLRAFTGLKGHIERVQHLNTVDTVRCGAKSTGSLVEAPGDTT